MAVLMPLGRLIMRRLQHQIVATSRVVDVPLRSCVHPYCAFRYGEQEYHPYETYQVDMHRGMSVRDVRRRFVEFLRHYRPRHWGEALGIRLSQPWPVGGFPWEERDPGDWRQQGWTRLPDDSPDLLTHFSEAGIPSVRIDEEFMWLERALRLVSVYGYRPEQYGPAEGMELRRRDGQAAYLLMDGNHRAGALVALGYRDTMVVRCDRVICEDDADEWPLVRLGRIRLSDALMIFHAFFRGNTSWEPSVTPAEIIAPVGWKALYL